MTYVLGGLGAWVVLLCATVAFLAALCRAGERSDRLQERLRAHPGIGTPDRAGAGRTGRPASWRRTGWTLRERHLSALFLADPHWPRR